jgi:hypothetical protein
MSLDLLREVRRAGQRPESVIVVIGRADMDDSAGVVQITDTPHSMDLRPLIRMPVHVIDLQDDAGRTRAVIAALEELNVTPLGICGPAGSCGVSKEHERAMERYRESLCKS